MTLNGVEKRCTSNQAERAWIYQLQLSSLHNKPEFSNISQLVKTGRDQTISMQIETQDSLQRVGVKQRMMKGQDIPSPSNYTPLLYSIRSHLCLSPQPTFSAVSQFEDPLERECCSDGMMKTPLSYSCETRSEYIGDGAACVKAFLHCCKEMENQLADRNEESLQLARSKRRGQGTVGGWFLSMVILVVWKITAFQ